MWFGLCVHKKVDLFSVWGLNFFVFFFDAFSAKATDEYEMARKKVADFVNASDVGEIVFTKNATEAINLVANSWGIPNLKAGDEVVCQLQYLLYLMLKMSLRSSMGIFFKKNFWLSNLFVIVGVASFACSLFLLSHL